MSAESSLLGLLLAAGIAFQPSAASAGNSPVEAAPAQKEFSKAVQKGNLDRLRMLVAAGADVNKGIGGLTPLMLARDPETVRLLAQSGADVNAASELLNQTALVLAVGSGRIDMVRTLLKVGADVNARDGASGTTALSHAVMNRRTKIEMIKVLLDAGADPNDGLVLDMPMLSLAALSGRTEVVKALISRGRGHQCKRPVRRHGAHDGRNLEEGRRGKGAH